MDCYRCYTLACHQNPIQCASRSAPVVGGGSAVTHTVLMCRRLGQVAIDAIHLARTFRLSCGAHARPSLRDYLPRPGFPACCTVGIHRARASTAHPGCSRQRCPPTSDVVGCATSTTALWMRWHCHEQVQRQRARDAVQCLERCGLADSAMTTPLVAHRLLPVAAPHRCARLRMSPGFTLIAPAVMSCVPKSGQVVGTRNEGRDQLRLRQVLSRASRMMYTRVADAERLDEQPADVALA